MFPKDMAQPVYYRHTPRTYLRRPTAQWTFLGAVAAAPGARAFGALKRKKGS